MNVLTIALLMTGRYAVDMALLPARYAPESSCRPYMSGLDTGMHGHAEHEIYAT